MNSNLIRNDCPIRQRSSIRARILAGVVATILLSSLLASITYGRSDNLPESSLLRLRLPKQQHMLAATNVTSAIDAPDAETAGWTPKTPYPSPVARYAFAQSGQDLYVLGGIFNSFLLTNVRKYNAATDSWTSLADLPEGSEAPAAAVYNEKIYLADGGSSSNLLHIYDIASNTWSDGPARPGVNDSYGAAAGAYNGLIYFVGGNNGAAISTVSIYNTATNSWSVGPAAPAPVELAGYKQIGRFLYVVGGITNTPGVNSTMTMRFDMANNIWSVGPSFTPQRSDFALAVAGTKLFAIGGDINGGGPFDSSAEVNELETSTWPGGTWIASPSNLPTPRQANSAGYFSTGQAGGEIWSTGGFTPNLGSFLSDHLLRPATRALTCQDYNVSTLTGSIVPATNDVGNHCNDCVTGIALPFPVRFYDQTFTSANVSSNGNLQFTTANSTSTQTSLAMSGFGPAIFPLAADLVTTGTGNGIFTAVEGSTPNRTFDIEWRAGVSSSAATTNFELRFFEGSSRFEIIYGATNGIATGAIGGQRDATTLFTQYAAPGSTAPPAGTRLEFTEGCCPPTAFSGAIGSNSASYPGTSGTQTGRLTRSGAASACGAAKAYPGTFDNAPRSYDAYTFRNAGAATCVTFTVTGCTGDQLILPVAYLGSFNPANIATNYLGDVGSSPAATTSFSVNVPANATVVLVIAEVNPGGGCAGYSVSVDGLSCSPVPLNALSRKNHTGVGPLDIVLPLAGKGGIECRTGGATADYQMVIDFANNVTFTAAPQAEVISGTGAVGSGGASNGGVVSLSGTIVTVPLTSVGNAQTLMLRLNGVNDGTSTGNVIIPMRVLIGDANGDAVVNSADATTTRNRSGQTTDVTNFRADYNSDGNINSADATIARLRSGTFVP